MRRALILAAVAVIAIGGFLGAPESTQAASLGFPYYGGLSNPNEPLLPCTGFFQFAGQSVVDKAINGLPPCTNICQIFEFANRLIMFAVTIMVTIITPLFVFVGAVMIFISGGDPGKRQQAGKILQGVAIGLALVLGSTLIVNQMLFVIFNRTFGEAIKDKMKARINEGDNIGITAGQVDGLFGFDNMACRVVSGGIEFTPYTTKKKDDKSTTDNGTIIINNGNSNNTDNGDIIISPQ